MADPKYIFTYGSGDDEGNLLFQTYTEEFNAENNSGTTVFKITGFNTGLNTDTTISGSLTNASFLGGNITLTGSEGNYTVGFNTGESIANVATFNELAKKLKIEAVAANTTATFVALATNSTTTLAALDINKANNILSVYNSGTSIPLTLNIDSNEISVKTDELTNAAIAVKNYSETAVASSFDIDSATSTITIAKAVFSDTAALEITSIANYNVGFTSDVSTAGANINLSTALGADKKMTGTAGNDTFTFTADSFTTLGSAMTVDGGAGNDTFTLSYTTDKPMTVQSNGSLALYGGTGNDSFTLSNVSVAGALKLYGGGEGDAGSDTFTLSNVTGNGKTTVDASGNTADTINLNSTKSIELKVGASDTIVLASSSDVTLTGITSDIASDVTLNVSDVTTFTKGTSGNLSYDAENSTLTIAGSTLYIGNIADARDLQVKSSENVKSLASLLEGWENKEGGFTYKDITGNEIFTLSSAGLASGVTSDSLTAYATVSGDTLTVGTNLLNDADVSYYAATGYTVTLPADPTVKSDAGWNFKVDDKKATLSAEGTRTYTVETNKITNSVSAAANIVLEGLADSFSTDSGLWSSSVAVGGTFTVNSSVFVANSTVTVSTNAGYNIQFSSDVSVLVSAAVNSTSTITGSAGADTIAVVDNLSIAEGKTLVLDGGLGADRFNLGSNTTVDVHVDTSDTIALSTGNHNVTVSGLTENANGAKGLTIDLGSAGISTSTTLTSGVLTLVSGANTNIIDFGDVSGTKLADLAVQYNDTTSSTTLKEILATWNGSNGNLYYGVEDMATLISMSGLPDAITADTLNAAKATIWDGKQLVLPVDSLGTNEVTYNITAGSGYTVTISAASVDATAAWNFNSGTKVATLYDSGKINYSINSETTLTGTIEGTLAAEKNIVLEGLNAGADISSWSTVAVSGTFNVTSGTFDSSTQVTVSTNRGYNVAFESAANVLVSADVTSNSTITGSTGADTISVALGSTTLTNALNIVGNDGADKFSVTAATVGANGVISLVGGADADEFDISNANVKLDGGKIFIDGANGDDHVTVSGVTWGTNNNGTISAVGGEGSDEFNINVTVDTGNVVTIDAGAGSDTAVIDGSGIQFNLGAGDDAITVSGSNHTIDAASGNDVISLAAGASNIFITSGSTADNADTFAFTFGGSDTGVNITGFDSSDTISLAATATAATYDTSTKVLTLTDGTDSINVTIDAVDGINNYAKFKETYGALQVKNGADETSAVSLSDLMEGWKFENKQLIYSENGAALVTVGGGSLSSLTDASSDTAIAAITLTADTFTFNATASDTFVSTTINSETNALTISGSGAYENVKFDLADLTSNTHTDASWNIGDDKSASYSSASDSAGYATADSATKLYYVNEFAQYGFKITGLEGINAAAGTTTSIAGIELTDYVDSLGAAGQDGKYDGVIITSGTVITGATDLTSNVTVSITDNYTLQLSDTTAQSSTSKAATWSTSSVTVSDVTTTTLEYLDGGVNAGFLVYSDTKVQENVTDRGTSIVYNIAKENTSAFEITGLNSSVTVTAENSTIAPLGITIISSTSATPTVQLGNGNLFTTTDVTITDTNASDSKLYTLSDQFTAPSVSVATTNEWYIGSTTSVAEYRNPTVSEKYEMDENSSNTTIAYTAPSKGDVIFEIGGLNSDGLSSAYSDTTKSFGNVLSIATSDSVTTVTVADSLLVTGSDVTLAASGSVNYSNYALALSSGNSTPAWFNTDGTYFQKGATDGTVNFLSDAHYAGHNVNAGTTESAPSITYLNASSGSTVATITGLKVESLTNTTTDVGVNISYISDTSLFSVDSANSNTFVVSNTLVNGTDITVSGTTYGVKLKEDIQASVGSSYWRIDDTNTPGDKTDDVLTFMSDTKTYAYSSTKVADSDRYYVDYIEAQSGTAVYELTGINTNNDNFLNDANNKTAEGFAQLSTSAGIAVSTDGKTLTINDARYLVAAGANASDIMIVSTTGTASPVAGFNVVLSDALIAADSGTKLLQENNTLADYLVLNSSSDVAVVTGSKGAGYVQSSTATSSSYIKYNSNSIAGSETVTISGISTTGLENTTVSGLNQLSGTSVTFSTTNTDTIVIDKTLVIMGSDVSLTGAGAANYGLALNSEISVASGESYWTVDGSGTSKSLVYKTGVTTDGYSNVTKNGSTYIAHTAANAGTNTYTLQGITTNTNKLANGTGETAQGYATLSADAGISIDGSTVTISDTSYINLSSKQDIKIVGTADSQVASAFDLVIDEAILASVNAGSEINDYLTVLNQNNTKSVAYITNASKPSYQEADDNGTDNPGGQYYKYSDLNTGTALFTINGIVTTGTSIKNSTNPTNGVTPIISNSGISLNDKVITISGDLLNQTTPTDVTLTPASGVNVDEISGYALRLSEPDQTKYGPQTWNAHFEVETSGTTKSVVYKNEGKTAGYVLSDASGTVLTGSTGVKIAAVAASTTSAFTLTGINAANLMNETNGELSSSSGIALTTDKTSTTLTIAESLLGASDVTLDFATTGSSDTYKNWAIKIDGTNYESTVSSRKWASANNNSLTYNIATTAGYSINGSATSTVPSITYNAATTTSAATITGDVTGIIASSLDNKTQGKVVTLDTSILGQNGNITTVRNIEITGDGYKFALDPTVQVQNVAEKYAATTTTVSGVTVGQVTYTEAATTAGWKIINDSATKVTSATASGGNNIVISGLSDKVSVSRGSVSGIDVSDTTIIVSGKLLDGHTVTLDTGDLSTNYEFALKATDSLEAVNRTADYWTTEENTGTKVYTAVYRDTIAADGTTKAKISGYKLSDNHRSILVDEAEGKAILTIAGVKSNVASKIKTSSTAPGVEDNELNGATVNTANNSATIASALISTNGVTVDAGANEYTFTLGGKGKLFYGNSSISAESTLIGSSGKDTIQNASGAAVTIDGGKGNDVIIAGDEGDSIVAEGNDSITLGKGADTVSYVSGKVSISGFDDDDDKFTLGSGVTVSKSSWDSVNGLKLTLNNNGTATFVGLKESDSITIGESGSETTYAGSYVYTTGSDNNTTMSVNTGFTGNSIEADYGVNVLDVSASKSGLTIVGGAQNNTIVGSAKADSITTTTGQNSVNAGAGNDTIIAEGLSNTLYGGDGKDVFVISSGNVLIEDYTKGDKISLGADVTIQDVATVNESSVSLALSTGSTVTVQGGKATDIEKISISENGADFEAKAFGNHAFYNAKKTAVTLLSSADSGDFSATSLSAVASIDAAATGSAIELKGNAKNNVIIASDNGSTINGGAGKDSLYGGEGNDVFVYDANSGNDIIFNYTEGNDVISLASGFAAVTTASLKSGSDGAAEDVVMSIKNGGTLTIKEAAGKQIEFAAGSGSASVVTFGNKYYTDSTGNVTMYNNFKGAFDAATEAEYAVTINAESSTGVINITGNAENNVIYAGTKAASLDGGNGNDTLVGDAANDYLVGGEGDDSLKGGEGKDTFVFDGQGEDVVTDYTKKKDKIKITVEDYTAEVGVNNATTGTVVFTAGNGTLTLENVDTTNGVDVTIVDANGKAVTKNFKYDATAANAKTAADLFQDNNYVTDTFGIDDVADVSDNKFAVGDVKTDTNANLVPNQTDLTYGTDKDK